MRNGYRANIQGRDIGTGLISTVNKLTKDRNEAPVSELLTLLDNWFTNESDKENAKRFPSETRLQGLEDRYLCLQCFCEDQDTAGGVIDRINKIFTDDGTITGVRLSSIHRAKGLEAKRVFFLKPKGGPRRDKMQGWEIEQEYNLEYVAITRAIETLTFVTE